MASAVLGSRISVNCTKNASLVDECSRERLCFALCVASLVAGGKSIFMFVPHSRSNERWPVAWYRVILAHGAGICFVPIVLGEIQDAASCVSQKMSGHIGAVELYCFMAKVSTCETGSTLSWPVPNTWAASVVEKSVGSRELEIYLRMYCKLDKYSVADLFQQIHFESNHEISLQLHETSHHHHSRTI